MSYVSLFVCFSWRKVVISVIDDGCFPFMFDISSLDSCSHLSRLRLSDKSTIHLPVVMLPELDHTCFVAVFSCLQSEVDSCNCRLYSEHIYASEYTYYVRKRRILLVMYPSWVTRVSSIPLLLYVLFYFVGSRVEFTSRTTAPIILCIICFLQALVKCSHNIIPLPVLSLHGSNEFLLSALPRNTYAVQKHGST